MPIIATHEIDVSSGSPQIYNAMDSLLTSEILGELKTLLPGDNAPVELQGPKLIYDFERALQAPALEMMLRGWRVDPWARDTGTTELRRRLTRLSHIIDAYAGAIWNQSSPTKSSNNYPRPTLLNPDSTKQLQIFFYEYLKLPKIIKRKEGKETYPMDRDSLEKLESYFLARPIIAAILAYRDTCGQLEVLESEVDEDWRMRSSYNPAATKTGRWCLSPSTEILTREGWMTLEQFKNDMEVACWNHKDSSIEFLPVNKVEFENEDTMVIIENRSIHAEMTPNHKIPWFTDKGNFYTSEAGEYRTLFAVPLCGNLQGSMFEDFRKTRVCVMTQADGSIINDHLIRFHLKKERKITRCQSNLNEAGICYKTSVSKSDGTTYIYVYNPPQWMFKSKYFGAWLLNHYPETVIEELVYWDGYKDTRQAGMEYTTTVYSNAEWVQTMAHLANRSVKIKERKTGRLKNWSTSYRLWIGETNNTRVYSHHYSKGDIPSKVFCLETATGYFLIRSKGRISITGNSSSESLTGSGRNIQNVEESLRYMFIADKDYKLIGADYEQSEARDIGWLCFILFNDSTYLDACESGDLHTFICKLIWPNLDWNGDAKHDRAIADQNYYRHHSYRDIAKRAGHATSYLGQAVEIARQIRVPLQLIREFQELFFAAFPAIRKLHTWVAGQLQREHYLINAFGRRRDFFGRADSTETIKQAVADLGQSTTANRTNLALWRIWKYMGPNSNYPVQLLAQLHDAIYLQRCELDTNESEVITEMQKHMDVRLSYNGRVFSVPTEVKTGWSWSNAYDTNKELKHPDGLMKFSSNDNRTRIGKVFGSIAA